MEKAGMYVRLFFKENTTGSVRCGRGERKDTDGIKAEISWDVWVTQNQRFIWLHLTLPPLQL